MTNEIIAQIVPTENNLFFVVDGDGDKIFPHPMTHDEALDMVLGAEPTGVLGRS